MGHHQQDALLTQSNVSMAVIITEKLRCLFKQF